MIYITHDTHGRAKYGKKTNANKTLFFSIPNHLSKLWNACTLGQVFKPLAGQYGHIVKCIQSQKSINFSTVVQGKQKCMFMMFIKHVRIYGSLVRLIWLYKENV